MEETCFAHSGHLQPLTRGVGEGKTAALCKIVQIAENSCHPKNLLENVAIPSSISVGYCAKMGKCQPRGGGGGGETLNRQWWGEDEDRACYSWPNGFSYQLSFQHGRKSAS